MATLKTRVSNIESFSNKIQSAVRASVNRLKELTYTFIQLFQWIGRLNNFLIDRYGREDERSFGGPSVGGSTPRQGIGPNKSRVNIDNPQ